MSRVYKSLLTRAAVENVLRPGWARNGFPFGFSYLLTWSGNFLLKTGLTAELDSRIFTLLYLPTRALASSRNVFLERQPRRHCRGMGQPRGYDGRKSRRDTVDSSGAPISIAPLAAAPDLPARLAFLVATVSLMSPPTPHTSNRPSGLQYR